MKTTLESPQVWTDVAIFERPETAKALRAVLEESGYTARVHDERKIQRFWFLVSPHAALQVQVPDSESETVTYYLNTTPGTRALMAESIRCPACHSPHVQYPQMTRKFILPTLIAQVFVFLGIMKPEYYCEDCHHTWQSGKQTKT
jgi:DNA-directed RNA polymerase subunit M/transcription elongation factor TFIIS